jgi:hypothetical protein
MKEVSSKQSLKLFQLSLITSGLSIRLLGDVYIGELLLAIFVLSRLLLGKKFNLPIQTRALVGWLVVWFFANFISSFVREKSISLTLIAIFTVVISGICLVAILHFFQTYKDNQTKFILLFGIGKTLGVLINPSPYAGELPWKFGFGEPVIIISLSVMIFLKKKKIAYLLLPLLAFVSLTNEARTLTFLVLFALACFTASSVGFFKKYGNILVLITLVSPLLYVGYLQLALDGRLGSTEIVRAEVLTSTDLGPLVARKEFIFSAKAFMNSPLIGYGFNPEVSKEIILNGYQHLSDLGVRVQILNDEELPIHSYIMGALIQGGFFAGFYWSHVLLLAIRALKRIMIVETFYVPLISYVSIALINRIFFSPFGASERLIAGVFIGILVCMNSSDCKKNE